MNVLNKEALNFSFTLEVLTKVSTKDKSKNHSFWYTIISALLCITDCID